MPSRRKCDRPRFTAGCFVAIDGARGRLCARVRCRVEGAGLVRGSLGAQVLQRWHVGTPSPAATESAHVSLHQHGLRDVARTVEPRSGERHHPLIDEAAGHSRQRRAQDREAWQRRGLPLGPARPLQKDRWVPHGSGTQLRRARSLGPRLASPAEGDVGCNVGPARGSLIRARSEARLPSWGHLGSSNGSARFRLDGHLGRKRPIRGGCAVGPILLTGRLMLAKGHRSFSPRSPWSSPPCSATSSTPKSMPGLVVPEPCHKAVLSHKVAGA
jgi:hypothetical protein